MEAATVLLKTAARGMVKMTMFPSHRVGCALQSPPHNWSPGAREYNIPARIVQLTHPALPVARPRVSYRQRRRLVVPTLSQPVIKSCGGVTARHSSDRESSCSWVAFNENQLRHGIERGNEKVLSEREIL